LSIVDEFSVNVMCPHLDSMYDVTLIDIYTVMWTNIIITAVHTYCNYMYMSISHWVTQHWTMTSVLMIWLYFTECLEYANSHCLFVCLSVCLCEFHLNWLHVSWIWPWTGNTVIKRQHRCFSNFRFVLV